MAPPAGRLGPAKLPVQVRLAEDEVLLIDGFAAELSRQSYGAAFSRAEAIRLAALAWLRERQEARSKVDAPPIATEPAPDAAVTTRPVVVSALDAAPEVPQAEEAAAAALPAAKAKRSRK